MSERIPSKKQNFDGIDPQESLIKSLESIKSLLKQGDSKISEARASIARADKISSDNIESKLIRQSSEIPNTSFISSSSIQQPVILETTDEQESSKSNEDIMTLEEIVIDGIPEDNIFNPSSTVTQAEPINTNNEDLPLENISKADNSPLKDLYDHDLIVPMLDEIIMPEDQNSSLFNMDSSVEIELDSKLTSTLLQLNETDELNDKNKSIKSETKSETETDISFKNKASKSAYNYIKISETNTNADIISFELSANAKKNNLKKIDNQYESIEKPGLNTPKKQNSISLVEDSQIDIQLDIQKEIRTEPSIDHVVIKETTIDKIKTNDESVLSSGNDVTKKLSKTKKAFLEKNLIPAIESATYTDDVLSKITTTNNDSVNQKTPSKPVEDDLGFSTIEGLDRLKFNAEKMSSLQKRVEKRVHNRLIELIVQLDDEIKNIFKDEIKNCIALEAENKDVD